MSVIQWLEQDLANLPSVSFKVVQLAVLDVFTLAWGVILCYIPPSTIAVSIYNAWLLFLAGLHGFTLYAFRTATQSPTTTASGQQIPAPIAPVAPAASATDPAVPLG